MSPRASALRLRLLSLALGYGETTQAVNQTAPFQMRRFAMQNGAILDDYQNVAKTVADWSGVERDIKFRVYNEGLGGPDKVIAALKDCAVVCLMRERTLFNAEVINSLPNLKLIVTSGMRNAAIDVAAAAQRNIPVCGTESLGHPTAELTLGMMLELSRKIGHDIVGM
jgi:D-3-phosphoglycerate dehydrogenase